MENNSFSMQMYYLLISTTIGKVSTTYCQWGRSATFVVYAIEACDFQERSQTVGEARS